MKFAVVGAGGFIGRRLVDRLARDGHAVVPVVRTPRGLPGERPVADLCAADWPSLLAGVDVVVHLAARVHQMEETCQDPLAEYRRVNRDGALCVAEAAAREGVKRFVFVSSIKVNGEETAPGRPFRADDEPRPRDPYGVSKLEAERALYALAERTGLDVTVVRPPLVYGPGVGGNFRTMVKWLRRGVPLPLGGARDNRRSLVALDNLVDLLALAATHPAAASQVFLVSDDEDVSTAELLRRLAAAIGAPGRLVSVPAGLIVTVARLAGKGAAAARLFGNLEVDISKTRDKLGWRPPLSVADGLRAVASGPAS